MNHKTHEIFIAMVLAVGIAAAVYQVIRGGVEYKQSLMKATQEAAQELARIESDNPAASRLSTVRHDGRMFVVRKDGGVIHHPSCPCLSK